MKCQKCELWTQAFLKAYPMRKGYGMCEECYEESKEFYVYLNLGKEVAQMKTIHLGEK